MTLQARVDLVEGRELIDWEIATHRHDDVERDGGVALAEDEPVPILPSRSRRVEVEPLEEQVDEHVSGGQRATQVTGPGFENGLDDQLPSLLAEVREFRSGTFGFAHIDRVVPLSSRLNRWRYAVLILKVVSGSVNERILGIRAA